MNHSSKKIRKALVNTSSFTYIITLKNNRKIIRNMTETEKKSLLNDSLVVKCERAF